MLFKAVRDQSVPQDFLPLLNDLDQPVTGLPNGPLDDAPGYLSATVMPGDVPLPFNEDGLDPEEVHTLPGCGFILVDDYSPSAVMRVPKGMCSNATRQRARPGPQPIIE